MDCMDDSENNAKISDSAYSNSCSNSQSRRRLETGKNLQDLIPEMDVEINHDNMARPSKDSHTTHVCVQTAFKQYEYMQTNLYTHETVSWSRSSKSTHSGSNSSGSSGYGGKPSTSGSSSNNLEQKLEKRGKDKDCKKKKSIEGETTLTETPAESSPEASSLELKINENVPAILQGSKKDDVELPLPVAPEVNHTVENMDISTSDNSSSSKEEGFGQKVIATSSLALNTHVVDCSTHKPQLFPNTEGFSCVISMHDGVIMYTTPTIFTTIGFPKDMLIGRSFIDFVHPKDRNTFAAQIMNSVAIPRSVSGTPVQPMSEATLTMCCRIRRYRGLKTGFGVKNHAVTYMPFLLSLSFKEITHDEKKDFYLVVQASPFTSAYKVPNQPMIKPVPFITRHMPSGKIEYIDPESVPYLGYLPQDLIDKDILLLYHPDDLSHLSQVYATVVRDKINTNSKVYRILAQNGDYVKLETEFSCFVNPWSRKLEFVCGKHFVVEGPTNPEVFFETTEGKKVVKFSETQIQRAQILREGIIKIMNEQVSTKSSEAAKQQMSKRCIELANYMESLVEEQPKAAEELRLDIQEHDNSYYKRNGRNKSAKIMVPQERDSVMLGGISPHHENESKSSSETPHSYNQLNYNENLQRYFNSYNPFAVEVCKDVDGDDISMDHINSASQMTSPMGQNTTARLETKSSEEKVACKNYPLRLSEPLLTQHNADMEKELVKKHREQRPINKGQHAKEEKKQKKKSHLARCNAPYQPTPVEEKPLRGVKRSLSQSELTPTGANARKHHCTRTKDLGHGDLARADTSFEQAQVYVQAQMQNIAGCNTSVGMYPMYYLPTTSPTLQINSSINSATGTEFQPTVPYVMYQQAVFGTPLIYPTVGSTAAFHWVESTIPTTSNKSSLGLASRNYEEACKPNVTNNVANKICDNQWKDQPKADSQGETMSYKADQGSGLNTSHCTSSIPSYVMESGEQTSDSQSGDRNSFTRKQFLKPHFSKGHSSSQSKSVQSGRERGTAPRTDGESSFSSFGSTFCKTDSGSNEESDSNRPKDENVNKRSTQHLAPNESMVTKRKEPPWMEQVCVTSDLIYKYQIVTKNLEEVLEEDKKKMSNMRQPHLVNEQLSQLYTDLQLEGVHQSLMLEEGITSSSGSSGEETMHLQKDPKKNTSKHCLRKKRDYSRLVVIYEEDAPLPSPVDTTPLSPGPPTSNL